MHDGITKTIVITGASDGIGAAASKQLADTNTRLIIVGRSPEKTKKVAEEIGAEYHLTDFAHLDEVRELAIALNESCERIDVLANNAGGMFSGPTATTDGFETNFQVDHLAPYLLTNLLIDKLIESKAAVINTSSLANSLYANIDLNDLNNWQHFTPNKAYGDAKLANILFTKGLHDKFHNQGLSTVAFHPGIVATNFAASSSDGNLRKLYHSAFKKFLTSAEDGGKRLRYFIEGKPNTDWISGQYYKKPNKIGKTNKQAYDSHLIQEHWDISAEMLGITWP
ncbi:MAG: SDR family NAD(P)-dependent oxidoreductase [Micrococcaceae bacterium]